MGRLPCFWLWCATCWVGLLPVRLCAQPAARGQNRLSVVPAPSRPRFAIMGQIARAGTYEFDAPASTARLSDLVERAGGLLPEASGNVRIIRGGRPGNQTFFSPRTSYTLLPGDLVIVDRRGNRSIESQVTTGQQGASIFKSSRSEAPATSSGFAIGLVNLLDWPVVFEVPADQPTLKDVLTALHQPANGPGDIMLIKPGAILEKVALDQTAKQAISATTVLVFDRKRIDLAALPRLAPLIRSSEIEPAAVEPVAARPASVATPPTQIPRGQWPAPVSPTVPAAIAIEPAGSASAPGDGRSADAASALPLSTIPSVPDVDRGRQTLTTIPPAVAVAPAPAPPAEAEPRSATQTATKKSHRRKTLGRLASDANQDSLTPVGWGVLTAAGLGGMALGGLVYRGKRRRAIAARPVARDTPAGHSLDDLIQNRVVIVAEPIVLPHRLQLHGRPGGVISHQVNRGHPPEPPQPHFRPQPVRMATVAPFEAAAALEPVRPAAKKSPFQAAAALATSSAGRRGPASSSPPGAGVLVGDDVSPLLGRVLSSIQGHAP